MTHVPGKGHQQALFVRKILNSGCRVYQCSSDPNKDGEIVDVNLPKELEKSHGALQNKKKK